MASKYREAAQAAVKDKRFDDAIEAYNQAIELDKASVTLYSGRSSVFLAIGDHERALEDAKKCLEIRKHDPRGHGCRAAVYHAQKQYAKAIKAYADGLKYKKDSLTLLHGLAASKKAKAEAEMSSASQAAEKTQITGRASVRLMNRARNAKTLSSYVKQKKKELEMTLVNIQSQLDLIKELTAMSDESKMDFIFRSIDVDGNGMIDADELAEAMRKKSRDLMISFSLENAMELISKFDKGGQSKLGPSDFSMCVNAILADLKIDLLEFSQFLVLQTMGHGSSEQEPPAPRASKILAQGDIKQEPQVMTNETPAEEAADVQPSTMVETESNEPKEAIEAMNESKKRIYAGSRRPNRRQSAMVKPRRQSSSMQENNTSNSDFFANFNEQALAFDGAYSGVSILDHPRVKALFQLFVQNSTGQVYFRDVAPRLFNVTSEMDETVKTTMQNLLMMEKGDTRLLTHEKFGRLLMTIVSASKTDFSEVADDLMISLMKEEAIPDRIYSELVPGRAAYKEVRAMEKEKPRNAAIIKQLSTMQLSNRSLPSRQWSFQSNNASITSFGEIAASNAADKETMAKDKGAGTLYVKHVSTQKQSMNSSQLSASSLADMQASARSMSETSGSGDDTGLNALVYARLQKLFDMWDTDHDEHISFTEMQSGLQSFQRAAGIDVEMEQHTRVLLMFDDSGDECLDRHEFVRAMLHYALWFMVDIHELIDFMSVAALLGIEESQFFQKAYGETFKRTRTESLEDSFLMLMGASSGGMAA